MTRLEENYKKNCITFPRLFNPRFLLLYPRFRIARLINNFVAINAFAMSVERNFCRVSEGGKKPVERTISGKEGGRGKEETRRRIRRPRTRSSAFFSSLTWIWKWMGKRTARRECGLHARERFRRFESLETFRNKRAIEIHNYFPKIENNYFKHFRHNKILNLEIWIE